ncbi:MAG TPA: hypothetical protein VME47_21540 [Acetobacteraceae bacterium]|nr:hypothetical protein [Acetobacteraceae bacterium]
MFTFLTVQFYADGPSTPFCMTESTKARTNGREYAGLTARNAALAVERRRNAVPPQRDRSPVGKKHRPI